MCKDSRLRVIGKTKDDEDVSGTITIPEVAHDTEEDEYVVCSLAFLIIVPPTSITDSSPHVQFDIDIYSESTSKQPVKDLVRSKIVPQLRKQLITLGPALIKEHGKDLQHAPDSSPSSGLATPTHNNPTSSTTAAPATAKPPSAPATTTTTSQSSSAASLVNTTTVTSTEEFRTTAAELYQTFTDPSRLAAFTRAPPKLFEGAHVGGKFELFGGNVMGEYAELEAPTKLVQKWRLKQWPAGHYSRLEIRFDQNDVDAVTVMRVVWDGVPVGQEEVTRRNWGEYYVRSIKTTFG